MKKDAQFERDIRMIVEEEDVDDTTMSNVDIARAVERAILDLPPIEGSIPIQRLWKTTQEDTGMSLGQFKRWLRHQVQTKNILLSKVSQSTLSKNYVPHAQITQSMVDINGQRAFAVDQNAHIRRANNTRNAAPAVGPSHIYPSSWSAEDIRRFNATPRQPPAVGPAHIHASRHTKTSNSPKSTPKAPQAKPRPTAQRPASIQKKPTDSSPTPGSALAITLNAVSHAPAESRFGPEKVFISEAFRLTKNRTGMSLPQFKQWLIEQNREQNLDLVRADLVGAMNPKLVNDSEIEDLGATFHFIVDRNARHRRPS